MPYKWELSVIEGVACKTNVPRKVAASNEQMHTDQPLQRINGFRQLNATAKAEDAQATKKAGLETDGCVMQGTQIDARAPGMRGVL